MPQSFASIIFQIVFSTKDRMPVLDEEIRPRMHAYLAEVCREATGVAFAVGGVADHVHIATALPRTLTIADLVEKLPIDQKRLYLTGSSMGGSGTWSTLAKWPDVFACGVVLCGSGDPKTAETIKNIPIWVFHGDKDDMVPVERARTMFAALQAVKGNIQYSELTGEGHNIAGIVYPKRELREWMFEQRKGEKTSASSGE